MSRPVIQQGTHKLAHPHIMHHYLWPQWQLGPVARVYNRVLSTFIYLFLLYGLGNVFFDYGKVSAIPTSASDFNNNTNNNASSTEFPGMCVFFNACYFFFISKINSSLLSEILTAVFFYFLSETIASMVNFLCEISKI